jgi:hypothetical protein
MPPTVLGSLLTHPVKRELLHSVAARSAAFWDLTGGCRTAAHIRSPIAVSAMPCAGNLPAIFPLFLGDRLYVGVACHEHFSVL